MSEKGSQKAFCNTSMHVDRLVTLKCFICLSLQSKDSSPSAPPAISMVLPVSVPVQSRGASKMCRSGQRRCSHLAPANTGTGLFRSLMHLKEEEQVTSSNKAAGDNGEDGHYTPPPMLCPHRVGPGLFCSLATRQQRVQTIQQGKLSLKYSSGESGL